MRKELVVHGAVVEYGGVRAVRGVDLEVAAGESVAVLGANGAGKTSLLRAISGLVPLAAGTVAVGDVDVTGRRTDEIARLGVALVPDDRGIFDELTVGENLRVAAHARDLRGGARDAAVDAVHELFPVLHDRRDQVAGTLSGGQQQMLAIGRALVQQPRLLLVDEMSMGLAPSIVTELFEVVAGLTDRGMGVLLVEQFVDQALTVVDRAVVMAGGRAVARGTAGEVAEGDVVRHYLGGDDRRGGRAHRDPAVLPASESVAVPLDARDLRALEARAAREGQAPEDLLAAVVHQHLQEDGT